MCQTPLHMVELYGNIKHLRKSFLQMIFDKMLSKSLGKTLLACFGGVRLKMHLKLNLLFTGYGKSYMWYFQNVKENDYYALIILHKVMLSMAARRSALNVLHRLHPILSICCSVSLVASVLTLWGLDKVLMWSWANHRMNITLCVVYHGKCLWLALPANRQAIYSNARWLVVTVFLSSLPTERNINSSVRWRKSSGRSWKLTDQSQTRRS